MTVMGGYDIANDDEAEKEAIRLLAEEIEREGMFAQDIRDSAEDAES